MILLRKTGRSITRVFGPDVEKRLHGASAATSSPLSLRAPATEVLACLCGDRVVETRLPYR